MSYCRKCGAQLKASAVLCPHCEEPTSAALYAASLPKNRGFKTAASVLSFIAYVILGIALAAFFVFYFSAPIEMEVTIIVLNFDRVLNWTVVSLFLLVFSYAFAVAGLCLSAVCMHKKLVGGEFVLIRGVLPVLLGIVVFVIVIVVNFMV